ncbi:hypothetical protein ACFFRR_007156 [Megaselia abdita]
MFDHEKFKHLLKYLKFDKDIVLSTRGKRYTDWASEEHDRKSYSGYALMLGDKSILKVYCMFDHEKFKHLLKYLKFDKDIVLSTRGKRYTDWASEEHDRKSYSGYALMLGDKSILKV